MEQLQAFDGGTCGTSDLTDVLGAVLTYRTKGHNRPCGQTIGANGAGEFAVLISGKPEDAWAFAGEYLRDLERRGYRIEEAILVTNEECYSGHQIITAQAPNALAQADAACGVSPGAMGSAASDGR